MTMQTPKSEFDASAERMSSFLHWNTPELSSSNDPLVEAMQQMAKSCNTRLGQNAAALGDETRSETISRLSSEAGMQARPVVLKEQRIGDTVVPLLAIRKCSTDKRRSDPVLLYRRGCNWSIAESGTRWRKRAVKTLDLSGFEKYAYMVLPCFPEGKISLWQLLNFGLHQSRVELLSYSFMTLLTGAVVAFVPMVSSPLLDYVVPEGERTLLYNLVIFLVLLLLVNLLTRLAAGIAQQRVHGINGFQLRAATIERTIRIAEKQSEMGQPLPSAPVAVLSSRSIETWYRGVWGLAISVVSSLMIALPSVFVLATTSLLAALIVSAVLVFMLGFGYWNARYRIKTLINGVSTPQSWMTYAYEGLSMVDTIRASAAEGRLFTRWADAFMALRYRFLAADRISIQSSILKSMVDGLLILAVIVAIAVTGNLESGSAPIALVIAAGNISGAVSALLGAFSQSSMLGIQYRMIEPLLKAVPKPKAQKEVRHELRGQISCQSLVCRHGVSPRAAIDNIGFHVQAGEHIGIAGPSGAGKSTLVKCLLGLIPYESGTIRFDGLDLASLDMQAVRRQIGVVGQNDRLFPGTLFENIAVGADVSVDDVMTAVSRAGMLDEIEALPLGLYTPVGETECGFSGGQVQRILLARAFLGKPRILIFDEATSALDARLQDHVNSAIHETGATVIMIAHRLETLRSCDRILVLDRGQLVEQGPYKDLAEANGLFASLIDAEAGRTRLDTVSGSLA
ncbi:ATP-binding cassette domain-containing protein [Cohaesibacter haloalkalitolerans]|uniref:ATP-binding cassette domain-containing protein n=1 Tax=Cohaesibacter haloalkalitolerans TaxID=1162980 RepID=UPI000E648189|nr:ATP-binding cassette domain-containing protein [Cohaesibacter haloalkalitolerans]